MREDVILRLRQIALYTLPVELQPLVIGLSAKQDCMDRLEEGFHAVIAGGSWAVKPINTSISASNVAVSAGGDHDNYLAVTHDLISDPRSQIPDPRCQ